MKKIKFNIDATNPEVAVKLFRLLEGKKFDCEFVSSLFSKGSNNPKRKKK